MSEKRATRVRNKYKYDVPLPDSLQTIGEFAFYACEHLSLDEIPKKVNKIGQQAFSGCKNLKQIILSRSITYFGVNVFSGCEKLQICCYRNSQAQKYAESNNIPFILIKDSVNPPDAPQLKDKSYYYIRIVPTVGYEYKMDNGEWQDSNVFDGLTPNEKHTFYQRIKETDTTYASKASLGTEITTDKMSVNAPSAPTVATKTHNSVTLNRVSGCEYSIDVINWQSSNVFENLDSDTEYTFYQRVAETDTTYASESSTGLTVKTDKDYISGDIDGDETITDRDAVYLLYYTFLPDLYPINQNCDFNGDGQVNDKDAVYLLYHTFLPDLYPIK